MGLRVKSKKVFGVGVNDADYLTCPIIEGKKSYCPYYRCWRDMLRRCYDEKYLSLHPSYVSCSVCSEWLTFSNFRQWMIKQDWQGKDLDKDLCGEGKIYDPKSCAFVTKDLNRFLTLRSNHRSESLLGVRLDKRSGKYYAQGNEKGDRVHLGSFETKEEAHYTYLEHKILQLNMLLEQETDNKISEHLNKLKSLIHYHIDEKRILVDFKEVLSVIKKVM